jgi:hypothetical protein
MFQRLRKHVYVLCVAAAVTINAAERSFGHGNDGGVALQSFFKRIVIEFVSS